jgi:hypothetical protein
MTAAELIALAERVEKIGIDHACELASRGRGTMWAQMAADCLATAAALRAKAAELGG